MTDNRPTFLRENANLNGADLVSAFRALPIADAIAVEVWLLIATVYGSITWQEQRLFEALEHESLDVE